MALAYGEMAEVSRVRLAEPLACGMTDCASPTTSGLLEPDPQTRGLWRLLPVCAACDDALNGASGGPHTAHGRRTAREKRGTYAEREGR